MTQELKYRPNHQQYIPSLPHFMCVPFLGGGFVFPRVVIVNQIGRGPPSVEAHGCASFPFRASCQLVDVRDADAIVYGDTARGLPLRFRRTYRPDVLIAQFWHNNAIRP